MLGSERTFQRVKKDQELLKEIAELSESKSCFEGQSVMSGLDLTSENYTDDFESDDFILTD